MNLVVNARDALPSGGEIAIETRAVLVDGNAVVQPTGDNARPYLCLSVRDNGIGMDAATQARIFEPFFTTKARGQGTGLGLATVYGIVRQSGGHIAIDSSLGHGTTVNVYVPAASHVEAVDPVVVMPASPRLTGTETILIAEDESGLRALARRVLQEYGYTTIEAGSGPEAVAAGAGAASLDLLLADMVMPGLSGPGLFHAVRAQHPALRAVYMSGYAEEAEALREVQAMGGAFLAKPFQPIALVRKVRDELDR
jgi:CheY-like chemotaxis protein